jgi:hypothetical protein
MTTGKLLGLAAVFLVLFLVAAHRSRATRKRILGALLGGFVASAAGVGLDVLGTRLGWWYYTGASDAHGPWPVYVGVVFLEGAVALLGWRLTRRFGPAALALLVPAVALCTTASDFIAAGQPNPVQVIAAGRAPKAGDFLLWSAITALGLLVMRVFAGRSTEDELR